MPLPPDIDTEEEDTVEEIQTITLKCPNEGCTAPVFTDPKRYQYHLDNCPKGRPTSTTFRVNTDPPERKAETPKKETPKEASKVTKLPIPPQATATDKLKIERKERWTKYIVDDLNPFLFTTTTQFCSIPPELMQPGLKLQGQNPQTGEVITVWDSSTLKEKLTFSEKDANKLAEAAARFSISPMGMAITAWIESNAGIIALGLAAWVAGRYGWRVMQVKQEVTQLKAVMEQQQQAVMSGAVPPNIPSTNNGEAA